jgi:hypothetical protein
MFKDHQKKRQVIDVDHIFVNIWTIGGKRGWCVIPVVMANTRFY